MQGTPKHPTSMVTTLSFHFRTTLSPSGKSSSSGSNLLKLIWKIRRFNLWLAWCKVGSVWSIDLYQRDVACSKVSQGPDLLLNSFSCIQNNTNYTSVLNCWAKPIGWSIHKLRLGLRSKLQVYKSWLMYTPNWFWNLVVIKIKRPSRLWCPKFRAYKIWLAGKRSGLAK